MSLADVVGPFFITNPDEMFSLDRFHPSAAGYKRTAKAVLPSVLAALGEVDAVPFGHHAPAVAEEAPAERPHLRAMPDVGHDDWGIDDQVDGSGFDRREA